MKERAVLIDVIEPGISGAESELRLNELDSLVKTFGGVSVVRSMQKRATPDYKTYVGTGKVEEVLDEVLPLGGHWRRRKLVESVVL